MVKTSSTGIRKGHVSLAVGVGIKKYLNSHHQLLDACILRSLQSLDSRKPEPFRAEPRMMEIRRRGSRRSRGLADFHLKQLEELIVIDLISLVREKTRTEGTLT